MKKPNKTTEELTRDIKLLKKENRKLKEVLAKQQVLPTDLQESKGRLDSILSSMVDLVFGFDTEGRFIFYHAPDSQKLYLPPEQFIGRKSSEIMPPHIEELFQKAFAKVRQNEICEYEYWLELEGKTEWFSAKISPLFVDGIFMGAVAVARDITERKQFDKMKDTLIRNVSHTLKTPLALIEMAYHSLSKGIETNNPHRTKKAQEILLSNVRRVQKDIDNILNLAVLSERRPIYDQELIYLRPLLDEIFQGLHYSMDTKKIELSTEISPDATVVFGNRQDMSILFSTIIDNAIKFTDRGSVSVWTHSCSQYTSITVSDTGCGIVPEYKHRIFEKFYKQNTAIPGTGLGLTICREIVNRYDGSIDVMSDGENKGTTVVIRLPKCTE